MSGLFNVSSSPHVRCEESTRSIMYDVAIALIPATVFGVYRFGLYSLAILIVSIGFALLSEYLFQKLTGQKSTVSDGSALVTGLLLGLNLPPTVPLWMPALGSIFAVVFVKQFFGGLGQNFMNPALGARCFLLISFTGTMSNYVVDGVSGATPLSLLKEGKRVDVAAMVTGFTGGTIGEVSAIAVLIGGIYLLVKKIITWEIPVCYLVTFVLFEGIFGGKGFAPGFLLAEVCGGGLLLGAFFMATDYVTSPITKKGKILFGILLGILTGVFRTFGVSAEGVSYAIIFCNLLVPLIEKITMPTAFGFESGAMEGKKGMDLKTYRPAIMLGLITLVAGIALGGANQMTKDTIEKAQLAAQAEAYAAVCPDAASFEVSEQLETKMAELTAEDGTVADGQFGNIRYDSVFAALDASGNPAGAVINVTSKDGFGGEISLSVGVAEDGTVTGMQFLTINETAGLGMRAAEPEFMDQYIGKKVSQFVLTKEAPAADDEVQAISGASFTSNAVTNAMNAALYLADSAKQ